MEVWSARLEGGTGEGGAVGGALIDGCRPFVVQRHCLDVGGEIVTGTTGATMKKKR